MAERRVEMRAQFGQHCRTAKCNEPPSGAAAPPLGGPMGGWGHGESAKYLLNILPFEWELPQLRYSVRWLHRNVLFTQTSGNLSNHQLQQSLIGYILNLYTLK